jgi:hypothetical protein
MAYGTIAGVQALVPALGTITASSKPTNSTHVQSWLDEGSSTIDRVLAGAGYTVPVLSTATCYGELTALANLYAGAIAVMSRGLDAASGENESRSETWLNRFYSQLEVLAASTLADVPVATVTSTTGRRVRFTQLKKIDGYSAPHDDDTEMDS